MLCPYRQRCNGTLLQPAWIPRISVGSKRDLVMFCCAEDQVCSSRCSAYAVENAMWLAESFIQVCGIHSCQVPVLTFMKRILSVLGGVICDP